MKKQKKFKLKTKKAVQKRFKVTGTGKILRSNQLRTAHLRRKKSKSALRRYKRTTKVSKAGLRQVKRMLGLA